MPATRRPSTRPATRCARSSRRAAIRAASSPRRRRPPRRSRNACASTRRCTCSRATPMARSRSRTASSVKPGEQIGLLLGMANHDPRAFAEPAAFRPGPADQKNVSFGAGIHFCIGAPLARLELQVSLKVLFDRLPQLAAGRRAALPRHLSFPWAGKAASPVLTFDQRIIRLRTDATALTHSSDLPVQNVKHRLSTAD